jgi:hypothetical protein
VSFSLAVLVELPINVMLFVEPVSLLVRQNSRGVYVNRKAKLSDSATKEQIFTYPNAIDRAVPKPAPVGALMWVCHFAHLFKHASVYKQATSAASFNLKNRVAVVLVEGIKPSGASWNISGTGCG